jgi:hypothetical protein
MPERFVPDCATVQVRFSGPCGSVPAPVHLPVRFDAVSAVVPVGEAGFGAVLEPHPATRTSSDTANSGASTFTRIEYNLAAAMGSPRCTLT